jgi:hypothetical protein
MDNIIIFLFVFFLLLLVFYIVIKLVFYLYTDIIGANTHYDHTIFQIKIPKDQSYDNANAGNQLQQLHEDIGIGEALFSAIGGLRAERGIKKYFWGREDHFTFEIVANHKTISFYIVAPRAMSRYVEQQIEAYYPTALVEKVSDYNIFTPHSSVLGWNFRAKRHFVFPFKSYKKMESDPLNSLLNAMSKLDESDSIVMQFVVRSAMPNWHKKSSEVVKKAIETNSMSQALASLRKNPITLLLGEIFNSAKPQNDNDHLKPVKKLTALEEETLKLIEEKNSKSGLDVNVRTIVSAESRAKALLCLENIKNALSEYNYYEYGNSFSNSIPKLFLQPFFQHRLIKDYIYRRFNEKYRLLLNTEEMASLFHFPLKDAETPNIEWLTAKHASAPSNISNEGVILGHNIYRGIKKEIRINRDDRRRHTYIIGKSGVGKSVLLSNMAIQDIENGEGICLLDPHGDLIADVLERIPPERAEDVILFSPADTQRPMALNLLEFDARYPEQKTFVINEMIKIFDKLYDLKATGGPIFEQYIRNAMLLIMDDPASGSTLMEIPKVLADADFRKMKLSRCKDHTVVDFWRKEAEKAGGDAALANVVPYITSKLTTFISNDTMRPIIGQQKSSFNFRDIMDSGKILLVNLSKGQIGEINAFLLGLVLIGKILMNALARTDMPKEKRKDFYLYIDEFQNFTTDSVCSILSEARKYGLNLIMAHQYLGQLVGKGNDTAIKDAVFGNVGTWILFKIGSEDAEQMEKEFSPVFNKFDLMNIDKGTAYIKLLIDNSASRPFSMKTIWPLLGNSRDGIAEKIKTLSRLKYGRDRQIIEAEIKKRTNLE